jgi:Intein splicing domain/HNH endonuclease
VSDTTDVEIGLPVPTNGNSSLALTASTSPTQPVPQMDAELGVIMSMPFSIPAVLAGIGNYDTGDAQILLRRSDISVRQLIDMRTKDGQARALYRLMTLPIRAALQNSSWVASDDGGDAEAEFCEQMFSLPAHAGGMETTFHRFIAQVLLGIFDGFAAFEFVYHVPELGPLKGKVALKKMAHRPADTVFFLVDDHGNFNGFQQKCYSGDTLVPLLDGTTVTIGELSTRSEPFWVYSTDEQGKIVPGKATARKTSDSEPLLEVVLDNGKSARCTYTHPWRMRDGSYKRAYDLVAGDSLMPFYRQRQKLSGNGLDYEQVWHPEGWSTSKTGPWQWTHAMVAASTVGSARGGEVIHHVDFNRFNNDPSNLQRVTKQQHSDIHQASGHLSIKYAHAWWATPEGKSRRAEIAAVWGASHATPEFSADTTDRMYERWSVGVYDGVAATREAKKRGREVDVLEFKQLADAGLSRDEALAKLGVGRMYMQRILQEHNLHGWRDLKKWPVNHKVVSVRRVPAEAVYDIEVENYHNFALDIGVFVHNTVFQARPIDVYIEKDNAFYWAANEEENPFYGISFFQSAFYHYDKKTKLYYLAHLAAQHRAVGTRVGHIPRNANTAEKQAFRKALGDFGLAQAMLVPEGFSVDELSKSMQAFDFLGLINHHDDQMAKSVLVLFLDDTKPTRLVDFSDANDDMFLLMERAIMGEIAAKINHEIVPKFIDWNFGSGKYPEFQWGAFTDEQKSAIRTTFNALAIAAQTNVTPEFMFEMEKLMAEELGLDIDYDAIEQRQKAEAELEAKAKAAGLNNLVNPPPPGTQSPQSTQPPGQPGQGSTQGAASGATVDAGATATKTAGASVTSTPGASVAVTNPQSPGVITLTELARDVLEELRGSILPSN